MQFTIKSNFQPSGDQPEAIKSLESGIKNGARDQVLLGVTGSGKSLAYDEPIYIQIGNETKLISIGEVIDGLMERGDYTVDQDTDILNQDKFTQKYSTISINSQTGLIEKKSITQFTRHTSPQELFKITTTCGRTITTTSDHNFWVMRDGKLILIKPIDLRITDYLPTPRIIKHDNVKELSNIDILPLLDETHTYCKYSEVNKFLKLSDQYLKERLGYQKSYHILNGDESLNLNDLYKLAGSQSYKDFNVYSFSGKSLPNNLLINQELLNLIGIYIAKGHSEDRYLLISAHEKEMKDLLIKWLSKLSIEYKDRNFNPGDFQISHSVLARVLSFWCGHDSRSKRLPQWFLDLDNNQLATMLSSYMSGDGSVTDNEISITTASNQLASELSYAFLRYGIHARIRTKFKAATNTVEKIKRTYYEVIISGQHDLKIYHDQIGFALKRKQVKLSTIIHKQQNTNTDIIPIDGNDLIKLRFKTKITQKEFGIKIGINRSYISMIEHNLRKLSHDKYLLLLKSFPDETWLNIYKDSFWTKIKKVEKIPTTSKYVYDVAVEDNETFLAGHGGLIVHNTFTMANVIRDLNMPTLIISHNKTLAGQLYQEMRDFFPENAVSYFVSYYDYYQPEAYMPSSDTYIEKEATINERIDKLRLQSTTNIMTRNDVIVVASVSCIYNIGDPREYGKYELPVFVGLKTNWKDLATKLIDMQYDRSDYEFSRGSFRVRGYTMDIYPAYQDIAYRLEFGIDDVTSIQAFDPVSGKSVDEKIGKEGIVIFPTKLYLVNQERYQNSEAQIRSDLEKEVNALKAKNKLVEAQRLMQRTNYDLETLKELGSVNGIENYSRYFDGRKSGERPFCLPDFFSHAYGSEWLCIIDESHMTVPQIRGMFNGDQARKRTLIQYGFRLEAAIDNRPLKWDEFYDLIPRTIYVSATPNEFELEKSGSHVTEQLVRPTGIVDPEIEIRPSKNEIEDVIKEIKIRAAKDERVLVTTLTKKTAEDLAGYLTEQGVRAKYLHSDVKTLERTDILDSLRKNEFDVLIGVNLLREGLDLPEVTLVAILDADREGFLRSRVSLIQTMGRAARNIKGEVILYAETITGSMKEAIEEIRRRRNYQLEYNKKNNIDPSTIIKPLREKIIENDAEDLAWQGLSDKSTSTLMNLNSDSLTPNDREKWIKKLERDMKKLAGDMQFEMAIQVRDKIRELKEEKI